MVRLKLLRKSVKLGFDSSGTFRSDVEMSDGAVGGIVVGGAVVGWTTDGFLGGWLGASSISSSVVVCDE